MYEYAMFAQTCKKRCKTSKKDIKLEVIEEMMKKVKFLLALAMCFAMGVNVTACGVIEYSGTAVDSESSESSIAVNTATAIILLFIFNLTFGCGNAWFFIL